jgi:hypothetical protein
METKISSSCLPFSLTFSIFDGQDHGTGVSIFTCLQGVSRTGPHHGVRGLGHHSVPPPYSGLQQGGGQNTHMLVNVRSK